MMHFPAIFSLVLFYCFAQRSEEHIVRSSTSVPRYRLVSYLVQKSESCDAKVKGLDIPPNDFHIHVHLAWEKAAHELSTVVLERNKSGQRLVGANLVLPTNTLPHLYAPGNISNVIDFAINCYAWARPKDQNTEQAPAYVSALRAYSNADINRQLIEQTTVQFKMLSEPGAYHFVWEDDANSKFMNAHNYTKVACGNVGDLQHPCDWQKVGLPANSASNLCLYRTVNPSWRLQSL